MDRQAVEYCIQIAQAKQSARDWVNAPADFQETAVKWVYVKIKPHFGPYDIAERIAASRARNFHDLMLAIRKAEKPDGYLSAKLAARATGSAS